MELSSLRGEVDEIDGRPLEEELARDLPADDRAVEGGLRRPTTGGGAGLTTAAIQGVRGAFSHAAAIDVAGEGVEVLECRTFEDLFDAVAAGRADRGVVPVENSLAGAVQQNMDLLLERDLHVVAEAQLRVRLCLATRPGTTLAEIERVASHPVALEQCRGFFRAHPRLERVAAFDTAGSIQELMRGDVRYDAAIGSSLAASLYGANVLETDLEDDAGNYTRFLIIAREPAAVAPTKPKASLVFSVRHEPGSLNTALGVLAAFGVDLTRLESRPIPGRPWEYRFHADIRGVPATRQAAALQALRAVVEEVRVLGRYEERVRPGAAVGA